MLDQVHAFVDCDPQFGIHRPVRLMKGRSSRLVRQEFPMFRRKLPTLWTSSYFVSTVGGAPLPVIKHSIENQKHVSLKAYKYRLYPNNRQAEKLQWTLDRAESCTMLLYRNAGTHDRYAKSASTITSRQPSFLKSKGSGQSTMTSILRCFKMSSGA